jgi:hypothetical protein
LAPAPSYPFARCVMSRSYEEFRESVAGLSELITETIDESREGIPVGEITAALLETIGYYVGLCPPAVRQEMIHKFRKYLLEELESNIELSAQVHAEMVAERMSRRGQA